MRAFVPVLRGGELDVGLLRQCPTEHELDAALVAEEALGVLLATDQAERVAGPDGIRLQRLAGLEWFGFARTESPAWYDEVVAILRSHGLDVGRDAPDDRGLVAEVKLAAVTAGAAFALAPRDWPTPLPASVTWSPLSGSPLVRRTWAAWPATSRRRDLAFLVAALDDQSR
jgi:hypothetical protein